MIIILLIILLFCLGIFLTIYKNRLTSISIWTTGMMAVASFVYIINIDYFGNDISAMTVIAIVTSAVFYFIGELVGTRIPMFRISIKGNKKYYDNNMASYIPQKSLIIISTIFFLLMAVYKLYDMYNFALSKGHHELDTLIYFMRRYATTGQYKQNKIFSLLFSFAEAVSYVYMFYYIYNRIKKKKHVKILLFPIIGYFILLITTTGRINYIKSFMIFLGIMYVIMKNTNVQKRDVESKYIRYILLTGVIMIAVFYLYGAFFRKSQNTIAHYFANYFSAGLYGLDYYIKNPWKENIQLGQYTFSNYYYYLNKIFETKFVIPEHHLPFFDWIKSSSNIYTGYLFSLQDFGYIGLFFTRTLIAVFYSSIERYLFTSSNILNNVLACIIFGHIFYSNFLLPIADRFVELLTVTTFPSLIIAILVFNRLYLKSCNKNHKVNGI